MKKLPSAVLEASGAFDRNPARKRKDLVSEKELGNAPKHLTAEEKDVWKELSNQLPPGLATSADRFVFEIACKLMNKFRTVGTNSSETAQLLNALAKLGASPSDRSKCSVPVDKAKEEGNPFKEFVS